MIELDGNYGEGGGALVRVALALSALTGKEFHVANIRAGRKDAGLKAQHVTAIKALKKICQAETNEIQLGSTELYFKPGKTKAGRYEFDIGTAGSISLFLQAVLLPCLFAPDKVTLTVIGGTSGKWASSVDYLQHVLRPQLSRFVENIELQILQRGYYPQGGGKVEMKVKPKYSCSEFSTVAEFNSQIQSAITPIIFDHQSRLEQIQGVVNVSQQLREKRVAERIKVNAEALLRKYQVPITLRTEYALSSSIGGEIVLWASFKEPGKIAANQVILGADELVEKGKTSEQIGKEAAGKLIREIDSQAAVDIHAEDQLIPVMALLPGSSIIVREVSKHALTNIYVSEKFLPVRFEVEKRRIMVLPTSA
ncbi:MAG: RNA 3'-terminal phosphate cyclase [Nanoarchaeota archaeon]